MKKRIVAMAVVCGILASSSLFAEEAAKAAEPAKAGKAVSILETSKGSLPNDTSGATKLSLAKCEALGDSALKVEFAKGSSFGESNPKIKNWKAFSKFKVAVFNPSKDPVNVEFVVKQKTQKGRINEELAVAPGKSEISINIAGAANNDGTPADLAAIKHWYFSCDDAVTLFFGDFKLEE